MKRIFRLFFLAACLQTSVSFTADGWRGPAMRRLNPEGFYHTDQVTGQPRRPETNTRNQALLARRRALETLEQAHRPTTSSDQRAGRPTISSDQNQGSQVPGSASTSLVVAPSRDELDQLVTVIADEDAIREIARKATLQIRSQEEREQDIENSRNNFTNR